MKCNNWTFLLFSQSGEGLSKYDLNPTEMAAKRRKRGKEGEKKKEKRGGRREKRRRKRERGEKHGKFDSEGINIARLS